jgi:hypothetical protein
VQIVGAPIFGLDETVPTFLVEVVDTPKRRHRLTEPVDMTSLGRSVCTSSTWVVFDINLLSNDGRRERRKIAPLERSDVKKHLIAGLVLDETVKFRWGIHGYPHPFSDETHSAKNPFWGKATIPR